MQKNVFGEELMECNLNPITGWMRDGCCGDYAEDTGKHTVCVMLTDEFLEFSKSAGNDLSTPYPEFDFPGLKEGDRWCLCASRWYEAYQADKAPQVVLEATHEMILQFISLEELVKFAHKELKNS